MSKSLNLKWQMQEVTPTLLTGEDALKMYNSLPEKARVGLKYDEASKTVIGSTPLAVANLNYVAQEYGARTPNLADLSRPEIIRIAKDKHYIDSRNLVVRSNKDSSYSKNNSLLKSIYEIVEQKAGRVKDGFMIEGFFFEPDENDKNYGLKIVAKSDFKVIQDDRFIGHNGDSFSEVDELGMPLFNNKGSRTWYAKKDGLSRLCLDRNLLLGSDNDVLANSYDDGRVAFLK